MEEVEKKVRENFEKAFEQSLGEEVSKDEEDVEPEEEQIEENYRIYEVRGRR